MSKRVATEAPAAPSDAKKANLAASTSAADYKAQLLATLTDPEWKAALSAEFNKPYFDKICDALHQCEKAGKQVFPPKAQIFNAFNSTPLSKVKIVILGQDPYHDNGQAHGLCFSVQKGVRTPPSLVNIYKELTTDISGFKTPNHGYLDAWAQRGVLLLNAGLTVEAHKANSHKDFGWLTFTEAAIDVVNKKRENVVFINWGLFAQKKCKNVDKKKHCCLDAAHPSPLSVTKFLGCKVFSKANTYLKSVGKEEMDWSLPATI